MFLTVFAATSSVDGIFMNIQSDVGRDSLIMVCLPLRLASRALKLLCLWLRPLTCATAIKGDRPLFPARQLSLIPNVG